jgi:hypothetical protein
MRHRKIIGLGGELFGIDHPDEDHLLFVFMGHTLTEIQVFESMLCFTLAAIMKDNSKSDFETLMAINASKTLGQVANIVKTHLKDEELSDLLIKVKDRRNYFVHGFLRNYGWPMMGKAKYLEAINEMEELRKQIREVHERLGMHIANNDLAKIGYATIDKDGNLTVIADNRA